MRELTGHKVNPANDRLTIEVLDEPGPGGACHMYMVKGFHATEDNNPALNSHPDVGPGHITGATILFQNGPINEVGVNGVTHEALLAILIDRLDSFQNGPYRCAENGQALYHLKKAKEALFSRTKRRVSEGVEGTMSPDQADSPGVVPSWKRAAGNPIMSYFAFEHLPEHLQAVSRPMGEIAEWANGALKDGAEKSAGLRKLLEAKDCFVRAAL